MFADFFIVSISRELFHAPTLITGLLGFIFSVTNNFYWNYRFTFRNSGLSKRRSYFKYVFSSLFGLAFRMGTMMSLIKYSVLDRYRFGYLAINFLGILSATMFNFILAKYYVFNTKKDSV